MERAEFFALCFILGISLLLVVVMLWRLYEFGET